MAPEQTPAILVVEDSPVNQQLITYLLRRKGYSVASAMDGQEAVELCRNRDFDFILMDIEMPRLNGFDATQQIREMPRYHQVPIFALTGHSEPNMASSNYDDIGMNGHLEKPVDAERLYHLIDNHCFTNSPSSSASWGDNGVFPAFFEPSSLMDKEGLLGRVGGKVNFALHIMQLFFKGLEETKPLLAAAIEQMDREAIRRQAHKIKGSMANAGFIAGSDAILALEQQAMSAAQKTLFSLYAQWEDGIEAIHAEFLDMAQLFLEKRTPYTPS